jgi:hypothetical protein
MTPSQVCSDPEYLKNEVYEILLKSLSQRYSSQTASTVVVESKDVTKNVRLNRFKAEERGQSAHSRSQKHGPIKSQNAQNYDTFSPMEEPAF